LREIKRKIGGDSTAILWQTPQGIAKLIAKAWAMMNL
jgi:hypothetical protein